MSWFVSKKILYNRSYHESEEEEGLELEIVQVEGALEVSSGEISGGEDNDFDIADEVADTNPVAEVEESGVEDESVEESNQVEEE